MTPSDTETPPRRAGTEFLAWLKIGLLSFGGPAAHIALIQSEICDRLKWAATRDFVQGLSFVTLLPGPEAMQLGVYLGWRYGGTRSALIAGAGFVLPGAAIMIALTLMLAYWRSNPLLEAVFSGVQPVIAAFVLLALWRIAGQTISGFWGGLIAVSSFIALYAFDVPFPWIALVAAFYGLVVMQQAGDPGAGPDSEQQTPGRETARRSIAILIVGTVIGLALIAASLAAPDPVFAQIAMRVSTAVLVIFGGAYAVIGYIADSAVGSLGWMTADQVIDGLALAETAPGPLVLFNTYAGTMAAAHVSLPGAVAGGVLATVMTFLPSFVFVLAGAPYVSTLYANPWLRRALGGVTAAVIGLIASLAVLLATTVLWTDAGLNYENAFVTVLALGILATKLLPAPYLIVIGAAVGVLRWALIDV